MSERLTATVKRLTVFTKKGLQGCHAEFAAVLAGGTPLALTPDEAQLRALPGDAAQACRRLIAERSIVALTLEAGEAWGLQIWDAGLVKLELKRTVLLEHLRAQKEDGKDGGTCVRLLFVVQLDAKDAWPPRELVGRTVNLSFRRVESAAQE